MSREVADSDENPLERGLESLMCRVRKLGIASESPLTKSLPLTFVRNDYATTRETMLDMAALSSELGQLVDWKTRGREQM